MKHFNAKTIGEAISLLSEFKEKARTIAGGVDLVNLVKNRVVTLKALVSLKTRMFLG